MYLFQFPKSGGRNFSPYCLKVETYLRLHGIEYETVEGISQLEKFSRHKFPVIQYNNELIPDSEAIIKFCETKVLPASPYLSRPTDHDLDEKQRDVSTMTIAMVENSFNPVMACYRWKNDAAWKQWKPIVFGSLPFPISLFVPNMVRKNNIARLCASGIGKYSDEELLAQATNILGVLSRLVGDNKFIFGNKFHHIDIVVYAALAQVINIQLDTPFHRLVSTYPNLLKYVKNFSQVVEASKISQSGH